MSDLEHTAIERLKAASEMSLRYYEQPLVITDLWRMTFYPARCTLTIF